MFRLLNAKMRVEADQNGSHQPIEAVENRKNHDKRRDADGYSDDGDQGDDGDKSRFLLREKISLRYEGVE